MDESDIDEFLELLAAMARIISQKSSASRYHGGFFVPGNGTSAQAKSPVMTAEAHKLHGYTHDGAAAVVDKWIGVTLDHVLNLTRRRRRC